MTTLPAFRVRNLTFGYRTEAQPVLGGLTFAIPSQAVTAILGPNGAGKSTLLHLLLGWHRPQQGEILLHGKPLSAYARAKLSREVGLVPQREHVPFAFHVREYLLLGRSPHIGMLSTPNQQDLALVEAALERLGIAHLANREVASLSGGEHQLVLIARALIQGAPIVLLDEPTAHLDLGNKYRILDLLQSLADEGRTVVFSTHDPQAAASIANHILLLRSGQLLFTGDPTQALTAERLSALYATPLQVAQWSEHTIVLPAEPSSSNHAPTPRVK